MKCKLWISLLIGCLIMGNSFAQNKVTATTDTTESNDENDIDELTIVSYHVVETIKKPVGGSVTTYNVNSLTMINTNDLGPNNTRVITPKYVRKKVAKATAVANDQPVTVVPEPVTPAQQEQQKIETAILQVVKEEIVKKEAEAPQVQTATDTSKKVAAPKEKYVTIDILDTYERVLEKGYKSVDMLKKVADLHFFKDDFVAAAKWYGQLFEMTTDFDPIYYYRYGKSLEAINESEKAAQMMATFKAKSY